MARGRAARRPYSAPVLKEFGSVTALTQAGTGVELEGGAMMDLEQQMV